MADWIPVYRPELKESEWTNVRECLETTWISSRGRFVQEFEHSFATYVSSRYALSVCNGTVALHLALASLGIGPGDKVAVPTFTYIASVNAIRYVGAEPVFIDSDPTTLQMSPEDLSRRAADTKLRAVVVVHLYGQASDMISIMDIARHHKMIVIEDCAEAFGSRIGSRHVGNDGVISTYSLFGNKTITTGEGGMVVTNDATIANNMRKLRGQGLAGDREYWHDAIGYNFRMTNVCAAIGLAQLQRANDVIRRKRDIAFYYKAALRDIPVLFHDEQPGTVHAFWMCSITGRSEQERDALRSHLKNAKIETRPFFYPVHTMPMYRKWDNGPYTGAEQVAYRGLNLPSFPTLSVEQLERIVTAVVGFYRR